MDEDILKRARQFAEILPYSRALGMAVDDVGEGIAVMSMPWDESLVGDPVSGVIFGGAVSALMDTCSGLAVVVHPQGGLGTATLDLRIDYMRPATPGQRLKAQAICHHVTRTVAFVRATTWDGDESRPVATSSGAFTVQRPAPGAGR